MLSKDKITELNNDLKNHPEGLKGWKLACDLNVPKNDIEQYMLSKKKMYCKNSDNYWMLVPDIEKKQGSVSGLNKNIKKAVKINKKVTDESEIKAETDFDEYEDDSETWQTAEEIRYRDVFIYKDFIDTLDQYIKIPAAREEVLNKIVLRFLTLEDDEIDPWLNNKHGVPIHCKHGHIFFRKRSPKGSNINDLNRFLVCKGSQIKRRGIEDNDIVLLTYLGADLHASADYQDYADIVEDCIENSNVTEFTRVDNVKRSSNFGIIYKASITKGKHKIEYVPKLDGYQERILNDTLLVKPPCVVYGAAGTGKTLLSEELYSAIAEHHENDDILYLTYMPRLKNQVIADLKKRNVGKIEALDLNSLFLNNISNLKKNSKNLKDDIDFKDWVKSHINRKQYIIMNINMILLKQCAIRSLSN